MQENRSFDHYFGTMAGVRGFDDPTALKLPNGKSVFHQPDAAQSRRLPAAVPSRHAHDQRAEDPVDQPRLGRAARGVERRQDGQLAARPPQGRRRERPLRDGLLHARRHPVPVRAGRGVHDLRRLLLLGAGPDLAQPHVLDDRHDRSRRSRRRPDHQQQGAARGISAGPPTPSGWRRPASAGRSISRQDNYGCNMLEYFKHVQAGRPSSPLYTKGMVRGAGRASSSTTR